MSSPDGSILTTLLFQTWLFWRLLLSNLAWWAFIGLQAWNSYCNLWCLCRGFQGIRMPFAELSDVLGPSARAGRDAVKAPKEGSCPHLWGSRLCFSTLRTCGPCWVAKGCVIVLEAASSSLLFLPLRLSVPGYGHCGKHFLSSQDNVAK